MKLWIRSQDKETLRLAETLDIYNATIEGEEKCYVIEESGTDLGTYATKERALEVLEEIQNALIENETYDYTGYVYVQDIILYEMPKE